MKLTENELQGTSRAEFFYILRDLCLVNMVSVLPASKTTYLMISSNRPVNRLTGYGNPNTGKRK